MEGVREQLELVQLSLGGGSALGGELPDGSEASLREESAQLSSALRSLHAQATREKQVLLEQVKELEGANVRLVKEAAKVPGLEASKARLLGETKELAGRLQALEHGERALEAAVEAKLEALDKAEAAAREADEAREAAATADEHRGESSAPLVSAPLFSAPLFSARAHKM